MGKGTILSGGSDGYYFIESNYDYRRIAAQLNVVFANLAAVDIEITTETASTATLQAEAGAALTALDAVIDDPSSTEKQIQDAVLFATEQSAIYEDSLYKLRLARLKKVSFEKELAELSSVTALRTIYAWCADLTETLTGVVELAEIAGDKDQGIIIAPGFSDSASYTEAEDGILQEHKANYGSAPYYNFGLYTHVEYWRPRYRLATVTSVNYLDDVVDLTLIDSESSDGINLNQTPSLTDVPVVYMDCASAVLIPDDIVLVEYVGRNLATPRVIGFKENPRACPEDTFLCLPASDSAPFGWAEPFLDEDGAQINGVLGYESGKDVAIYGSALGFYGNDGRGGWLDSHTTVDSNHPSFIETRRIMSEYNLNMMSGLRQDILGNWVEKKHKNVLTAGLDSEASNLHVDWIGADGTRLSFKGPPDRYNPFGRCRYNYSNGGGTEVRTWLYNWSWFSKSVYQKGAFLFSAPSNEFVTGAAVRGSDYVVVTTTKFEDKFYIRPITGNDNIYHASTNLDGWKLVHTISQQTNAHTVETCWLFNSSGTAAQCLRRFDVPVVTGAYTNIEISRAIGDTSNPGNIHRYGITLSGETVSFTDHGVATSGFYLAVDWIGDALQILTGEQTITSGDSGAHINGTVTFKLNGNVRNTFTYYFDNSTYLNTGTFCNKLVYCDLRFGIFIYDLYAMETNGAKQKISIYRHGTLQQSGPEDSFDTTQLQSVAQQQWIDSQSGKDWILYLGESRLESANRFYINSINWWTSPPLWGSDPIPVHTSTVFGNNGMEDENIFAISKDGIYYIFSFIYSDSDANTLYVGLYSSSNLENSLYAIGTNQRFAPVTAID